MKPSDLPRLACAALAVVAAGISPIRAAVSAGSLAIIGYDDGQDSFSFVALGGVAAGETIYFTNNGWNTSLGGFNGASPDQGAGNESLLKFTSTSNIPKGTVISSTADGFAWSWTKSGLVPGQSVWGTAEFSDLSLDFESDQIYIFQAADSNPLMNPTNFIYAIHFGSPDNPGFSDAQDQLTGNVPPGLSELDHTAFAQTNFLMHGDADGNHSAWGLSADSPAISTLLSSGGHKEDWLAAINNSSNWSGSPVVAASFTVMPEPGRAMLIGWGMAGLMLRRRRKR